MLIAANHEAALEADLRRLKRSLVEALARQRPRHEIRAIEDQIRRTWEQLESLGPAGPGRRGSVRAAGP